jgi:hypothetical protein
MTLGVPSPYVSTPDNNYQLYKFIELIFGVITVLGFLSGIVILLLALIELVLSYIFSKLSLRKLAINNLRLSGIIISSTFVIWIIIQIINSLLGNIPPINF